MRWLAASTCGLGVYWLVGAVSDGEPIILRGAWGIVVAGAVLLLVTAYHRGG
jgi:hypothetical protein